MNQDPMSKLVKALAREVLEEELSEAKVRALIRQEISEQIPAYFKFTNEVEKTENYDKRYKSWTWEEDVELCNETLSAIEKIAAKHGRTTGAIKSRISRKGFIY